MKSLKLFVVIVCMFFVSNFLIFAQEDWDSNIETTTGTGSVWFLEDSSLSKFIADSTEKTIKVSLKPNEKYILDKEVSCEDTEIEIIWKNSFVEVAKPITMKWCKLKISGVVMYAKKWVQNIIVSEWWNKIVISNSKISDVSQLMQVNGKKDSISLSSVLVENIGSYLIVLWTEEKNAALDQIVIKKSNLKSDLIFTNWWTVWWISISNSIISSKNIVFNMSSDKSKWSIKKIIINKSYIKWDTILDNVFQKLDIKISNSKVVFKKLLLWKSDVDIVKLTTKNVYFDGQGYWKIWWLVFSWTRNLFFDLIMVSWPLNIENSVFEATNLKLEEKDIIKNSLLFSPSDIYEIKWLLWILENVLLLNYNIQDEISKKSVLQANFEKGKIKNFLELDWQKNTEVKIAFKSDISKLFADEKKSKKMKTSPSIFKLYWEISWIKNWAIWYKSYIKLPKLAFSEYKEIKKETKKTETWNPTNISWAIADNSENLETDILDWWEVIYTYVWWATVAILLGALYFRKKSKNTRTHDILKEETSTVESSSDVAVENEDWEIEVPMWWETSEETTETTIETTEQTEAWDIDVAMWWETSEEATESSSETTEQTEDWDIDVELWWESTEEATESSSETTEQTEDWDIDVELWWESSEEATVDEWWIGQAEEKSSDAVEQVSDEVVWTDQSEEKKVEESSDENTNEDDDDRGNSMWRDPLVIDI